ncbi:MAG: divergent polysaccharide deacetylase family protein [Beijerinckiaceae bacterium]
MAPDDLNAPLGLPRQSENPPPRRPGAKAIVACAAFAAAAGGIVWLMAGDDGLGGRAHTIARIERPAPKPPVAVAQQTPPAAARGADQAPTGSIAAIHDVRSNAAKVEDASGVKVVRSGGDTPGALIISIPDNKPRIGLPAAPDRRLVRASRHGLLPVTGPDGAKPYEVYARPLFLPGKLRASAPRVAIAAGGMGLSRTATDRAIAELPPAITLAFAPYGDDLQRQVARAREAGHEVLLQIPMEPFDLAGPGPGPHMLKTGYDRKEMKDHLHWHMGRFTGYIGVANFLGAKFSASAEALAPVIEEVRTRGLMYFDDGSSNRSLAGRITGASATPFVAADVILDETREERAIEAALLKLEALAVQKGIAVGFASGHPAAISRIAGFVKGLEKRGIALVPVSAALGRTTPVASSGQ